MRWPLDFARGRLRAWLVRFLGLFNGDRHERDLQDEIDTHLQLHIDDNLRAGLPPAEARRVALIHLGGVEALKEQQRDRRGIPMLQHLWRDARVGARVLRANPAFTLVAIMTLALGIGANAAIFSLVNAVILRPLPFDDPDRLVMIWATDPAGGDREDSASYPDFQAWRSQSHTFDSMAALTSRTVVLGANQQSILVPALQTSADLFRLLRLTPQLGRTLRPEDEQPGAPKVAVLSDAAWRTHFAARPDIVGTVVPINQVPHEIVGVAPASVRFLPLEAEQVYTVVARDDDRRHAYLRVVGRLQPGVSIAQAQAELDVIATRLGPVAQVNRQVGANVVALQTVLAGEGRDALWILLALVGAVLLIACTNVANLLLARNVAREHEFGLRLALGAGRGRIVQQLLVESVLLAVAGGALGLVVAVAMTNGLVALLSSSVPLPRLDEARLDSVVLGFAALVSIVSALVFGVVPAVAAAPGRVHSTARDTGRAMTGSRRGRRTRMALVVIETALALVLLAVGGMLMRAFVELRGTAPGFSTSDVLVVGVRLPGAMMPGSPRATFFEDVRARLDRIPGIRAAGFVCNLPMGGSGDTLQFRVADRPGAKPASVPFNIATPGYFRAMGITVTAGREFATSDGPSAPAVVVINEAAARRFWPNESAIGRRITLTGQPTMFTVVGVTGDVRQSDLATAPRPEIFLNALQPSPSWESFALVVATSGEPTAVVGDVRSALAGANRDVAIGQVGTVQDVLSGVLAQPRIFSILLGAFALLALALAAVGLYGVISYSVRQRTREFGIRMALGSSPAALVRSVVRQGAIFTLAGAMIGLGGGYAATKSVAQFLPGSRPGDPLTLGAVALLMLLVGLVASYVPARRAARVDPLAALRVE